MKAAFFGPEATFTDIAVQSVFPEASRVAYRTIPECLEAVKTKQVDMAVVPLENALEGSVNLTVDYLYHEELPPIRAEIIVPIEQHFMVHPANAGAWRETEKIISHSHALAQCHQFLRREFRHAEVEAMGSTAAAAKYVSEHPELKWGRSPTKWQRNCTVLKLSGVQSMIIRLTIRDSLSFQMRSFISKKRLIS